MSPDTWSRSAIKDALRPAPGSGAFRVLPPAPLLAYQLTPDHRTASLAELAMQRQRGTRDAMPHELDSYDDDLAYVFKHPRAQGHARFSPAQPMEGTLYAAFEPRTALAERGFHQVRFVREQGSGRAIGPTPFCQIAFDLAAMDAADVTRAPLGPDACWMDPSMDYRATQAFARTARRAAADGILYTSVRDPRAGLNVALFNYRVLARRRLDRRRVKDMYFTADQRRVDIGTTTGAHVHFAFDTDGRPV